MNSLTESQGDPIFSVQLKINTVSEANRSAEHWAEKRKRHKNQKWIIRAAFNSIVDPIPIPCIVRFSRLMPRLLDSDNLVSAFKWLRDEAAWQIFSNNHPLIEYKPGFYDSDDRISWEYAQEKSVYNGIKIEIFRN